MTQPYKPYEEYPQAKALVLWLSCSAGFVFAMIVVGAITRLTESGLSMVEWRPLMGALPPLNEEEWHRVFTLYKASPEYTAKNFWMSLEDFKRIFFWEWFHRLLGRTIGLVYALPLLYFWVRGMVPQGFKLRLLALLALGGAQGLMGWVMVQSGLVDRPSVSHFKLAAHLSLALLIFSLLVWNALNLRGVKPAPHTALRLHAKIALGFVICTILWGAFTAGLDAGLVYNETFPKMGRHWIPPEIFGHGPAWLALLEKPEGVQFLHRWLAVTTVLVISSLWLHGYLKGYQTLAFHLLAVMVLVQFMLGLWTLLSGVWISAAALHQSGAVLLLTLLIINLKKLAPVGAPSL
jgi:cytochrome c oxidase assembly protein subunit 15